MGESCGLMTPEDSICAQSHASTLSHSPRLLQVPLWSRIGRLKRQVYPKLTGGGQNFGGGASPGVMSALAGRLLCDTYLLGEEGGGDEGREALRRAQPGHHVRNTPPLPPSLPPTSPHPLTPSHLPSPRFLHSLPPPILPPLAARELVREVDYTLRTLSASLLGQVSRSGAGMQLKPWTLSCRRYPCGGRST